MVSSLLDFVLGAGLQLVLLLLGLLPAIDIASLPIQPPQLVSDALGALNFFVPIGDMLTILTVWIGLVLVLNVVLAISNLISSFK
jgi:hypothetical protein